MTSQKITFNLKDTSFAHVKCTVSNKESQYVNWDRSCSDKSRPTFYTNEQIFACNTPKEISYGLLYESKALIGKVFKRAPKVMDQFQQIFTYDPKLLRMNPEVFKFAPAGGIWIGEEYGGGSFGIKQKSKMVSIISSKKRSCRLHRYRYNLARKLEKQGIADVYGFDKWVHINQTLDDYMYSIIIENNSIDNYFTEKLMNCFAVGTVPIYLGCTNIDKYFNEQGIIRVSRWTNIKKIIKNLSREDYNSRLEAMQENLELCRQYEIIEDYIVTNYFQEK
ncbi:MAG: hypothetical protein KKE17_01475 [Proteobacteria bacterium]|nr:hypothetical protein [Pseudomonadota bacterium]MBU1708651.1 hypothetical protein [Pseudomonadota bacterium]